MSDTAPAPSPDTPPAASRSAGELLAELVPMVRTLGLRYSTTTPERAVAHLPDDPAYRNHVGGPHAGAMFTLAESASGAVVLAAFGDQLERAVPLPVRAEIAYRKVATGPITATATLERPAAEVVAQLAAGERPEFPVAVALTREDGAVTGEMTVVWTLRPHAPRSAPARPAGDGSAGDGPAAAGSTAGGPADAGGAAPTPAAPV